VNSDVFVKERNVLRMVGNGSGRVGWKFETET